MSLEKPKTNWLGDISIYGFAGVLTHSLSFFLIPLYTHFLMPADYGILELVNQIGMVVNFVFMLNGVRIATMTFYIQSETDEEQQMVVSSLVAAMGATFLGGAITIIPLAPYLATWFGLPAAKWVVVLGCITILAEILPVVPFTLMQARIESRRFLIWNVGSLFFRLTTTILAVTVFNWGVYGILLSRAVTGLATGLFLLVKELNNNRIWPKKSMLSRIAKYSMPMVPVGVFGLARNSFQRFFLLATYGPSELGVYALGSTISGAVALVIIAPFHRVWTAKMYEWHERADAAQCVGKIATKFILVYTMAGFGLVLFGKELLLLISTESYSGAWQVIVPILLAGLVDTFTNIPDQVFLIRHKTHYKPYIDGLAAIIAIVFYAWAIPRYGLLGAAYGLTLAAIVRSILTVFVSRKVFKIQYELGKIATLAGLTMGFGVISMQEWPSLWVGLVIKTLVFLAWGGGIILFRIISREEIQFLRGLIPKRNLGCVN